MDSELLILWFIEPLKIVQVGSFEVFHTLVTFGFIITFRREEVGYHFIFNNKLSELNDLKFPFTSSICV